MEMVAVVTALVVGVCVYLGMFYMNQTLERIATAIENIATQKACTHD